MRELRAAPSGPRQSLVAGAGGREVASAATAEVSVAPSCAGGRGGTASVVGVRCGGETNVDPHMRSLQ